MGSEGVFLWCSNAFRSVNSAFIWLRLVWLIWFIQLVGSIAVIPFVSAAGEDSSLQLYEAVSMGERVDGWAGVEWFGIFIVGWMS